MTRCATILIGIAILLMLIYMLSLPFLLEHYFSAPIGLSEITALYSSIITFILGLFGVYIAFQWTAVHKRIDVIKNDVDNEKMKIKDQLDMAKKTNGEMDKYLEVIKKDYRLKITLLVGEMERMMGRENYSQKNYPLAFLNFLRASMVYIFPDHRDNDALFKAILRPAFECAQQSHAGWTEIVSKFHDDVNDHLKLLRAFKGNHDKYEGMDHIIDQIVNEYYKRFNEHLDAAIHSSDE